MWKIKAYCTLRGVCSVQEQISTGSAALRANYVTAVEYLENQDKQGWRRPHAAKLSKQKGFRDFYEIRFKADNVQQRPIGYFGPNADDFTILLWATEKGNSLKPTSWFRTAQRLMDEIKTGAASAKEVKVPTNSSQTVKGKRLS